MVFIVAHRGASAYALENTLESFRKAIEMGAKYLECDIRFSKDKKLVVVHDANLQRIWRMNVNVNETNSEELKKYRIPLLEEVLDLVKKANKTLKTLKIEKKIIPTVPTMLSMSLKHLKHKKKKMKLVKLLIEIKEPECWEMLANLIEKKKMLKEVIVVSFLDEPLRKIKETAKVKTGFIFSLKQDPLEIAKAIKADYIIPRYDVIDKNLVKEAHKNKMKVIAWTIDDIKIARKMIKMHVDGIASNKPDLLSLTC